MPSSSSHNSAKKLRSTINLFINLFWSAFAFIPICVFCYIFLNTACIIFFSVISFAPAFFANHFINSLRISSQPKTYKRLGIGIIQLLSQNGTLVNSVIHRRYPDNNVVSFSRNSIDALRRQTYLYEKFHLVLLVFITLCMGIALYKTEIAWLLGLGFINLWYSVYPILLQQFIRLRLGGNNIGNQKSTKNIDSFFAFKTSCKHTGILH